MSPLIRFQALGERLARVLLDPMHGTRNVVIAIALYAVVWTVYATISTGLQNLHVDMTEEAVLARDWAWGYFKHPPLSVWAPGMWFAVFPLNACAYYLLSMSAVGVGLFAAWRIARRYLSAEKALLALALLTFIPFYNFHAIRFNANSLQIAIWPLATLFFLRSLENRRVSDALAAGAFAALAALTKYWAVFLLAGFLAAALLHPKRADYFRSPALWISAAVGAALVAPHLYWLAQHDFITLQYAAARGAATAGRLATMRDYLAATLAYASIATLLALWAIAAGRTTVADVLAPRASTRRALLGLFAMPILLPLTLTLAAGSHVNGLWTMPALALLPLVLLSSDRPLRQDRTATILAAAAVVPLAFACLSPIVAVAQAWDRPDEVDLRKLAAAVAEAWAPQGAPLRLVAGPEELAYGVAFYAPGRPSAFPNLSFVWAPFLTEARVQHDGIVVVCGVAHAPCLAAARERTQATPGARQIEISIAGGSFVRPLPPQTYVLIVLPPAAP